MGETGVHADHAEGMGALLRERTDGLARRDFDAGDARGEALAARLLPGRSPGQQQRCSSCRVMRQHGAPVGFRPELVVAARAMEADDRP